jgi:hypothetical protein
VDETLAAAARALDAGDVLEALKRVALREDAPALGLRGVALARLGQLDRARELLRAAARAFGARAPLGQARCLLADAEIALATRDLRGVDAALARAIRTLSTHGDSANATHAVCLSARSLLLRGRVNDAQRALTLLDPGRAPAALRAELELTWAELHLRALDARAARAALERAERAGKSAAIPALLREASALRARLAAPIARSVSAGAERVLKVEQVAALLGQTQVLLVDARELTVRTQAARVAFARRPVLFALVRALAEAWPHGALRASLIQRAFSVSRSNESHRARLRVEIARLRRALRGLAELSATPDGFRLTPLQATEIVVLARLVDDEHAAVRALLEDGEAWSSSALAVALGASQRSVQRALLALELAGKVRAVGRARAKRWLQAPSPECATPLLLPPAPELA